MIPTPRTASRVSVSLVRDRRAGCRSWRRSSLRPSPHLSFVIAAALAVASLLVPALAAPAAADPLDDLIALATKYVADYQQQLSMVVAQERYEQTVRYPAAVGGRGGADLSASTVLRSDFLLVKEPRGGWVPFRDVFEKDGRPVRDREERLSALFLDGGSGFSQAARITEESARYNLGGISRNINVPTLALLFLTPEHKPRVDFALEDGGGTGRRVIRFREVRGPTYISTTNGRDLPVSGRFWIDEATGRVERSEIRADDPAVRATIGVTYRLDETAGLWVPDKMEEDYLQKGDRSEIHGAAVYTNYRRFQVKTTEDVPAASQSQP